MSALVIAFDPGAANRAHIETRLPAGTRPVYLPDLDEAARVPALDAARVLFARNTARDLRDAELGHLAHLELIQFVTAGVDFIPVHRLPPEVPVAVNAGGYAEPMAEHALAMILAACKHLLVEHANVARGEFNQFSPTRMLHGMTAGILGFGGIGVAVARILRPLGVHIHAINRRGHSDEPADWMGTVDDLDTLLAASDILVLSAPLTARTEGLLGAAELARMKPDAILVNLARGEIVDEDALFEHLTACPDFTACIDAWWVEPVRHGSFRMDRPFTTLPNVIASPHNSASVAGWQQVAVERALENCLRVLAGEAPRHLIGEDERRARPT